MVRLIIPFIAGIITAINLKIKLDLFNFLIPVLVLLLYYWSVLQGRRPNYHTRWIFGCILTLCLYLFGYQLLMSKISINSSQHYTKFPAEYYVVKVIDEPQEKSKTWKMILEVINATDARGNHPTKGKLLAYLTKDSAVQRVPVYHDLLLIRSDLSPIPAAVNPGSFNYQAYLSTKGIYRQCYLRKNTWTFLCHDDRFSVKEKSLQVRAILLEKLKENGLEGREYGMAAALILGQDEVLDYETRKEFSDAGVVHILGISGLHVGILYMALNFFLRFLDKYRRGRFLKLVLVLFLIWFYALITGLSPAALRSSAMFTFVSLGNVGKRNVHIFNSLASSAFFLLLIDPYLITNPGFQFSYIAVIGIVLLQEPVQDLLQPRWWLIEKIWGLTVMSLTAQLFTFPISLLYFHQFPVYFLPANLVVVPLSNLIIYFGMGTLGASVIPMISSLIGMATSQMLTFLSAFTGIIDSLPFSVIRNIPFECYDTLLCYFFILTMVSLFLLRKKILLFPAIGSVLLLTGIHSFRQISHERQEMFMVYSISRHSAMEIIHGRESVLLLDSSLRCDRKLLDFSLSGSRSYYGLLSSDSLSFESIHPVSGNTLFHIFKPKQKGITILSGKIRIGILDSLPGNLQSASPLTVDYLLIRNCRKIDPERLKQFFKPGIIIFDGSTSTYKTNLLMKKLAGSGLNTADVKQSGAYVVRL